MRWVWRKSLLIVIDNLVVDIPAITPVGNAKDMGYWLTGHGWRQVSFPVSLGLTIAVFQPSYSGLKGLRSVPSAGHVGVVVGGDGVSGGVRTITLKGANQAYTGISQFNDRNCTDVSQYTVQYSTAQESYNVRYYAR